MDYGELTSNIYDLVSSISLHCSKEMQEECKKLVELKNITDLSTIINKIHSLSVVIKQVNGKEDVFNDDLLQHDIKNLTHIYNIIQEDLSKINETAEHNIQELQLQLKLLFENLINIIGVQSKKIMELDSRILILETEKTTTESRMTKLENKGKMMEKTKLIGDLLNPLAKELHDYLGTLRGKPHYYDDSSIYSAFREKASNNESDENQYKQCFGKPINENTYEQFYSWLSQKANSLRIDVRLLASFLRQKKMRNFVYHSDIIDFFIDSHTTFKCTFMDLIETHQIQELLKPEELDGLKNIFETYYKDNINKVREQQQASTSI